MKQLIFILLFISTITYGQTYIDSLSFFNINRVPNLLQTSFEKQLNTYYLNSNLNLSERFGKFQIGLHENYHSTFIKTNDKTIRDEHSFLFNAGYDLDSALNFQVTLTNLILSDDRKIEINKASVSNLILLTRIQPYNKVYISPFAGYSNNRQKLENDYGFIYGISGNLDNIDVTDLTVNSELLFRNEDIFPRRNLNRLAAVSAINAFGPGVMNTLNLRYSESRKDFYYDADSITAAAFNIKNNIQSRTESNYLLQNYLSYNNFLDIFYLDLTGRILWKNVERDTRYKIFSQNTNTIFDTDINELRMEIESGVYYFSKVHRTSLKISFAQRDEKHIVRFNPQAQTLLYETRSEQEKRKNNISSRTSLLLSSEIKLSAKDKLLVSILQNKLRYDTPSEQNYDDRDEILSIGRIRYSRNLTPFFEFFTSLEGNYSHIVYIFSQQSSNNYINRILKLNSGGIYRGKNVVSNNSFEVSANYTIYDFEDINPSYRSYSFRQFTASDSSHLNFGNGWGVSFNGYVKLSEQGDLRWSSFKTRPNRFLEEIYIEPKLSLVKGYLNLSGGIRVFLLKTYRYDMNEKKLNTRYNSTGPVGEVIYLINERMKARFFTWYEFITMDNSQYKEQINANVEVQWNF